MEQRLDSAQVAKNLSQMGHGPRRKTKDYYSAKKQSNTVTSSDILLCQLYQRSFLNLKGTNTETHNWTMYRVRDFGNHSPKWDIFLKPLLSRICAEDCKSKTCLIAQMKQHLPDLCTLLWSLCIHEYQFCCVLFQLLTCKGNITFSNGVSLGILPRLQGRPYFQLGSTK